ncbi:MAG: hypothetical protein WKF84_27905 [Pyrinomonadaceae bacterium]
MKKSRSSTASRLFTARAPLAALGLKLRSLKLYDVIAQHLHIRQKIIKHTPLQKLTDAFIAILSGAHGLSELPFWWPSFNLSAIAISHFYITDRAQGAKGNDNISTSLV